MPELSGSHRLFTAHYDSMVEAALLDIQLHAGRVPAIQTRAQSARNLAVRVMNVGLPRRGDGFMGTREHLAYVGVTVSSVIRGPALADMSGWDMRHPMMTG